MALLKLPSLLEVCENPSLLLQLPSQIAEEYLARFKQIEQSVSETSSGHATPIDMAIEHPRYRWMNARHLHYLGDQVAAAVDHNGSIIVTMPPRHAKTHTCSVWTPFWFLARRPEDHVLFMSYESNFARKWGIKVRGLIEMYGAPYGLILDPKKTAGDDWELTTGGGMKTVGAGGGIAGNPAKLLIADDLLKNDEEARSDLQRENVWEWWEQTVVQRIEPDTTTIVIGTRYHEDDIIGRLIQHSNAGDGLHFDEVTLRAKAEADDPLARTEGEGLWLEHFPQSYYDEREGQVSAYTWSSVYQQRPSPPGGNMVDPDWWRFYRPSELPSDFDQEVQTWDLALDAEKKTDSYHAGLVMSRKGALIFIRDGYHEHGNIAASPDSGERTVTTTIRTWDKIYPKARQKLVERAIAGPMLIQTMRHQVGGLIPWPPKGRRKGSKEACLNACVPDIRSGNVMLPINADGTKPKWVQSFIEELRQFPRSAHDDWVDAFNQGMAFMLPSVLQQIYSDQSRAKSETPLQSPQQAHAAALHALAKKLMTKKVDRMKREGKVQEGGPVPFGRINTGILKPGKSRYGRGLW